MEVKGVDLAASLRHAVRTLKADTGLNVRACYCRGEVAIRMWKLGVIDPFDRTLEVVVPDADLPLVQEYLNSLVQPDVVV